VRVREGATAGEGYLESFTGIKDVLSTRTVGVLALAAGVPTIVLGVPNPQLGDGRNGPSIVALTFVGTATGDGGSVLVEILRGLVPVDSIVFGTDNEFWQAAWTTRIPAPLTDVPADGVISIRLTPVVQGIAFDAALGQRIEMLAVGLNSP
jgi:hypothetical protein